MVHAGYSDRCLDLTTRWDDNSSKCVPCPFKPGYEVSPNCGYDDHGGRHEVAFKECPNDTFNDGSGASCRPCMVCPPGHPPISPCNATSDTLCWNTPGDNGVAGREPTAPSTNLDVLWAVPLVVLFLVLLCLVWMKRKRGQHSALGFTRGPSYTNTGFSPLSAPDGRLLEDTLDSTVLAAPIQAVLNNLDVLEDLLILLDPETQGVKNTKHLASHCGFSSAWITYAYSMRNSKSPLKAVLERVTSTHPDWTVGNIARMLWLMERNDAVGVLARLRPDVYICDETL